MIGKDKIIHFIVCFAISVVGAAFLYKLGMEEARAIAISTLIAFVAAIGKEVYDKYVKHTLFDVMDMVADITGIMFAAFAMLII